MLTKTAVWGLVYFAAETTDTRVASAEVEFENVVLILDGDATPQDKVQAMHEYAAKIGRPDLRPYTWQSQFFRTPPAWHEAIRAEWFIDKVVARCNAAEKEVRNDDDTQVEQRILLGSLINPSGKYYVPFAAGNVSGDCRVCRSTGEILNLNADKVARSRARHLSDALFKRLGSRYGFYSDYPEVWKRAVTAANQAADKNKATIECPVCRGCGSKSAADDEAWREAFEEILKPHGMNLENDENDSILYVITKYSPREEVETE